MELCNGDGRCKKRHDGSQCGRALASRGTKQVVRWIRFTTPGHSGVLAAPPRIWNVRNCNRDTGFPARAQTARAGKPVSRLRVFQFESGADFGELSRAARIRVAPAW